MSSAIAAVAVGAVGVVSAASSARKARKSADRNAAAARDLATQELDFSKEKYDAERDMMFGKSNDDYKAFSEYQAFGGERGIYERGLAQQFADYNMSRTKRHLANNNAALARTNASNQATAVGKQYNAFADLAAKGLNQDQYAADAANRVAVQMQRNAAAEERNLQRMGVNPNSGRFAAMSRRSALSNAAAQAQAANASRDFTETENFRRAGLAADARRGAYDVFNQDAALQQNALISMEGLNPMAGRSSPMMPNSPSWSNAISAANTAATNQMQAANQAAQGISSSVNLGMRGLKMGADAGWFTPTPTPNNGYSGSLSNMADGNSKSIGW